VTKLMAPMVGKIISVEVNVGDTVEKNQSVAVLEAMKMKIPVVAPEAGTIQEIDVEVGQTVDTGTVIAVIG
jgi:biotin carboxyl carrier protein